MSRKIPGWTHKWKLITVLLGGNDICSNSCGGFADSGNASPYAYKERFYNFIFCMIIQLFRGILGRCYEFCPTCPRPWWSSSRPLTSASGTQSKTRGISVIYPCEHSAPVCMMDKCSISLLLQRTRRSSKHCSLPTPGLSTPWHGSTEGRILVWRFPLLCKDYGLRK